MEIKFGQRPKYSEKHEAEAEDKVLPGWPHNLSIVVDVRLLLPQRTNKTHIGKYNIESVSFGVSWASLGTSEEAFVVSRYRNMRTSDVDANH